MLKKFKKPSRAAQRKATQFRPALENLEGRDLMTAALFSNGVLTIAGTNGDDLLRIREINGGIYVDNTNVMYQNHWYRGVNANAVHQIRVYGGAGNDRIDLASELVSGQQAIMAPCMVSAGSGNDVVLGAAGADRIFGQAGNDILAGGFGNDVIDGGWGNDILVGDAIINNRLTETQYDGSDYLIGGAGYDRFYGEGKFDWYHDDYSAGQPFVNGESIRDVQQNQLGTCQTLAAMTALVRQGHDFGRQISYLGDNTYRVILFNNGQAVAVNVQYNGWWSDNDPKVNASQIGGETSREFWPILLQRARLQMYGIDWGREYSDAQWTQLHQATGNRLASLHCALQELSGRQAVLVGTNQISAYQLRSLIDGGHAVVAGTVQAPDPGAFMQQTKIVPSHAYAVVNVVYQNGQWFVQLHNPWNVDSASGDRGDGQDDGFVWVSWSEFTSYFLAIAAV